MERMKKILIADSSEEFGLELRRAVEEVPQWEVVGLTCDGEEAMELLQKTQPDVLLLDLLLPRVDGIALLRQASVMAKPPVGMVLSGYLTDYITGAAS